MSRILAAKASLATRVDAMGTSDDATIGIESRAKVLPPPLRPGRLCQIGLTPEAPRLLTELPSGSLRAAVAESSFEGGQQHCLRRLAAVAASHVAAGRSCSNTLAQLFSLTFSLLLGISCRALDCRKSRPTMCSM